jgi:hypothetical protein
MIWKKKRNLWYRLERPTGTRGDTTLWYHALVPVGLFNQSPLVPVGLSNRYQRRSWAPGKILDVQGSGLSVLVLL